MSNTVPVIGRDTPTYIPTVPLPLPDPFDQQSNSRLPRDFLFIVIGVILLCISLSLLAWTCTAPWRARRYAALRAKRIERDAEQARLLQEKRRSRLSLALSTDAPSHQLLSRHGRPTSIYNPGSLSFAHAPQMKQAVELAETRPLSSVHTVSGDRRLSRLLTTGGRESTAGSISYGTLSRTSMQQSTRPVSLATLNHSKPSPNLQHLRRSPQSSAPRPVSQASSYLPAGYYRRSALLNNTPPRPSREMRPPSFLPMPELQTSPDGDSGAFAPEAESSRAHSTSSVQQPRRKQRPPRPPTELLQALLNDGL
ncbi:hypothetical protein BCR37DRAFT_393978 [Protomyces lactucae-debilis]|uniref:Uncharacterized protein n=1 Tax=Protomyces lactucae-debilis TaxID=2754530 RepID=A0A1Y2F7M8_PROLT|nr:uncharacterized protein BCR37DRAFT_393978 [Protomyces lactucae-debilis]ORY79902.1 hypothetical protein BCR37DRAFT_393978 [Protomyces lactucae-debilis]